MEYLGLLLLLEALAGEVLRRRGGVKRSGRKTHCPSIAIAYFSIATSPTNGPIITGAAPAILIVSLTNVGLFIPPSARKTVIGTRGATLQIIGI